jgi:pantetheine-phosphate adenylyltransferase
MNKDNSNIGSQKRIAIYPGTFDPITFGHIDIIRRAAPIFEKVLVTLAINSSKLPLFSIEERLDMMKKAINGIEGAEVAKFNGLVVDYASQVGASVLIRGLRAISDFEYEFQIALMNRKQHSGVDTVFLMPDERYTYLSSSLIKEIARHGGSVEEFVPDYVAHQLREKFRTL